MRVHTRHAYIRSVSRTSSTSLMCLRIQCRFPCTYSRRFVYAITCTKEKFTPHTSRLLGVVHYTCTEISFPVYFLFTSNIDFKLFISSFFFLKHFCHVFQDLETEFTISHFQNNQKKIIAFINIFL